MKNKTEISLQQHFESLLFPVQMVDIGGRYGIFAFGCKRDKDFKPIMEKVCFGVVSSRYRLLPHLEAIEFGQRAFASAMWLQIKSESRSKPESLADHALEFGRYLDLLFDNGHKRGRVSQLELPGFAFDF